MKKNNIHVFNIQLVAAVNLTITEYKLNDCGRY